MALKAITLCKTNCLKDYTLYDCIYTIFSKWRNYGDGKQIAMSRAWDWGGEAVTVNGYDERDPHDDRMVLYPDCHDGYRNPHIWSHYRTIHAHIVYTSHCQFWYCTVIVWDITIHWGTPARGCMGLPYTFLCNFLQIYNHFKIKLFFKKTWVYLQEQNRLTVKNKSKKCLHSSKSSSV